MMFDTENACVKFIQFLKQQQQHTHTHTKTNTQNKQASILNKIEIHRLSLKIFFTHFKRGNDVNRLLQRCIV